MNASTGTVETRSGTPAPRSGTIDPKEAAHFGRLAAEWWDPKGESARLHKLNPVRLAYIRAAIDRHWAEAGAARKPLVGRSAIDVGCGAGLLAEPLARLGARVTGLDAAAENVAAAQAHAEAVGLTIDYRNVDVETLEGETFDLVTSRHPATIWWDEVARVLQPGGAYFAQHVGPGSVFELIEFFLGPQPAARRGRHPDDERNGFRSNLLRRYFRSLHRDQIPPGRLRTHPRRRHPRS